VRLPGDQPVLPDGTINLGRYGRLGVAGKTVDEIEADVRALVQAQAQAQAQDKDKDKEKDKEVGPITVRVVTRLSKVYYVLGEVNAPGAFPLNGRETVLDAILAAGGLTERASRQNIILSRPTHPNSCRVVLPVCYPQIVQLGDTTTNYQIAPGDRIFVASRTCWEEMFHSKKECGLCDGVHTACPIEKLADTPCEAPAPAPTGPVLTPSTGIYSLPPAEMSPAESLLAPRHADPTQEAGAIVWRACPSRPRDDEVSGPPKWGTSQPAKRYGRGDPQ
jgi:hypothetical protein